jgi:hypothetical protein
MYIKLRSSVGIIILFNSKFTFTCLPMIILCMCVRACVRVCLGTRINLVQYIYIAVYVSYVNNFIYSRCS